MNLTVADIAAATGGRVAQGDPAATASGVCTDTRTLAPGDLFVALVGEVHDAHDYLPAACAAGAAGTLAARCPDGLPPNWPVVLVPDTTLAYAALAGWWRQRMPAGVLGITGSNGKTTTKEMAAHLLAALGPTLRSEANHNNHIGVPETLLRIRPHHRFAVVEMGTNHFGEIERLARLVRPNVGVITNIGATHLEAFGCEVGVAHEKARLLDFLAPGGLAVLHADDPGSRAIADARAGRTATFGFAGDAQWRATHVALGTEHVGFTLARTGERVIVPVAGGWQVSNCLAAMAAASEMGMAVREAAARMAGFVGPKWRMDVQQVGDLTLILDCYNANPTSMHAVLEELARRPAPGRRVAVLGDMFELGPMAEDAHKAVGRLVASAGIDLVCAVGEQSALLVGEALRQGLPASRVTWAADGEEAARWLRSRLEAADTVLFKGSRGMHLEDVAEAVVAWARAHAQPVGVGGPAVARHPSGGV